VLLDAAEPPLIRSPVVGRVADRLFWTEEGQAKTDERFRRARELRESRPRHPLAQWTQTLAWAAAVACLGLRPKGALLGAKDLPYVIAAGALFLLVVCIAIWRSKVDRRSLQAHPGDQPTAS
jgi:hypothetical protein